MPNFGVDVLAENKLLALGCKILKHHLTMAVSKPDGKELFKIHRQQPADLFFLPVSSTPLDEKVMHKQLSKPLPKGAFNQNQTKVSQENDNDLRLQEQMSRLQSIPKRKEEFSRLEKESITLTLN